MEFNKRAIIAVDMDGTLCLGENFTVQECLTAPPNPEILEKIEKLYKDGHYIVIYTARKQYLYNATEFWLRENKIKYHTLVCGKIWAEYYIDDRNVKFSDL